MTEIYRSPVTTHYTPSATHQHSTLCPEPLMLSAKSAKKQASMPSALAQPDDFEQYLCDQMDPRGKHSVYDHDSDDRFQVRATNVTIPVYGDRAFDLAIQASEQEALEHATECDEEHPVAMQDLLNGVQRDLYDRVSTSMKQQATGTDQVSERALHETKPDAQVRANDGQSVECASGCSLAERHTVSESPIRAPYATYEFAIDAHEIKVITIDFMSTRATVPCVNYRVSSGTDKYCIAHRLICVTNACFIMHVHNLAQTKCSVVIEYELLDM